MGKACDTHTGNKLVPNVACAAVIEDTILEALGVYFREFFFISQLFTEIFLSNPDLLKAR
jgi:hypothetical protein